MKPIKDNMNKYNEGFTLLELQVASLVSFITLLAIISIYIFSWRSFTTGDTLLDVYSNSRNAIGWITKDIRCAKQIVSSVATTADPLQFYTTTDNSIVLMFQAIDSSGNVVSPGYDYIIYLLDGSDLHRIVQKDPSSSRLDENRVIAKYCSSIVFSSEDSSGTMETLSNFSDTELSTKNTVAVYLPLNKVTISLSGSGTQTESIAPTTIIRLRNK